VAIDRQLQATGLDRRATRPQFSPISVERLARVHDPDYIEEVRQFVARGGGSIEADTIVGPESFDVALLAAGAVADAVERVIREEDTTALCLVRPPGHHARPAAAMGFCLFDNVAIGARLAIDEFGLDRVLVIDWDVHHGNGTQEIFWRDEQVGFFSVHRWPFYPGTGDPDENGEGPALGTKLNLPLEFGTPRREYIERFTSAATELADRIRPQLILISAGFDSHRTDPIGSLGLETEDFATLTEIVRNVARTHCGGRIVSVLEGGYNPPVLAECVGLHLEGLLEPEH
jgi:acetoin utilization deacetylase AcuC-like enzyme